MATPKKKAVKPKVKVRMRWHGKLGKLVKVDPARSQRAMKAAAKRRGKKVKFKNNAARIKAIKKAARTGVNKYGKKTRKWGRPKGSKDTRPRKKRSDAGVARGPRKKKRKSRKAA